MIKLIFPVLLALSNESSSIAIDEYYKNNPVLYIANQLFADPQNMTTVVLPRILFAPDSIINYVNAFEEGYFKNSKPIFDTSLNSESAVVNKKRSTMYKAIIALCGQGCENEAFKLSSNARLHYEYDGRDAYLAAEDEIEFMEKYLDTNKQSKIKQFIKLFILRRCFLAIELTDNKNPEIVQKYELKIKSTGNVLIRDKNILIRNIAREVLKNHSNIGI